MGRAELSIAALDTAAEGRRAGEKVSAGSKAAFSAAVKNEGWARVAELRNEVCWAESEAEAVKARSEKNASRFICIFEPIE